MRDRLADRPTGSIRFCGSWVTSAPYCDYSTLSNGFGANPSDVQVPAFAEGNQMQMATTVAAEFDVRFLTVAEVAAIMRVSKMTVYRLVHSGELPAVKVGRSYRVPEQAIHDYLRQSYVDSA